MASMIFLIYHITFSIVHICVNFKLIFLLKCLSNYFTKNVYLHFIYTVSYCLRLSFGDILYRYNSYLMNI